jgi:hypothetical protein
VTADLSPFPPAQRSPAPEHPARSARSPWALRPAESRPVAAVRLAGPDLTDVAEGLHHAGFGVFDILAGGSGPAPLVLVLQLPAEDEALQRVVTAGARGPGRVLLVEDRARLDGVRLRPDLDAVVDWPCHPLQVATAALRVSGAPEWRLARWSESVFESLPPR